MTSPSETDSSTFPTAKVTAFARLKSFTDTFTTRRNKPGPTFPPPSWEIDKLAIDSDNGWTQAKSEAPLTARSETEVTAQPAEITHPMGVATLELTRPEPLTLAQKIKDLIDSLPLPGAPVAPRQDPAEPVQDSQILTAEDGSPGPPVPPGVDGNIVRMLASEDIMNGDEKRGAKSERQSIWSALSGMRRKGRDSDSNAHQGSSVSNLRDQDGLMVYAPLEPTNNSQIELAEAQPTVDPPTEPNNPPDEQPTQNLKWVPSTTQISVYATWWGYRLYLPPPIMAKLDSVSSTAAAQAAMVTTALKWILDMIPGMLVPPQFKVPLQLLKRWGPVVSYIGVFIAWSWRRIKGHDKGNGVVLTATWLLPVALIPMAWDTSDIIGPAIQPRSTDQSQEDTQEFQKGTTQQQRKDIESGKRQGFWRS